MNVHRFKARIIHSVSPDSRFAFPLIFLFNTTVHKSEQIELLQIEWFDENKNAFRKTLEPQMSGHSYGPIIRGSQNIEPVIFPAINLYYFENTRVNPTSSSVIQGKKIIIERGPFTETQQFLFASGYHIFSQGQNRVITKRQPTQRIEKGVFMGGNGSFNYYHWMIEILPKLEYLKDIDEEYADFPLLVSKDVENIPTFGEALNRIAKNRPVITLEQNTSYCVEKLAYINTPNITPFNAKCGYEYRICDCITRASSINFLRSKLSAACQDITPKEGKRIFLARRGDRRNYNREEIHEEFERRGFIKVFMEEMSLQEQADLVASAEVIAGPTGAAWTNLIFCREGTKCLCWMAEESQKCSVYSNIAHIIGADLRYVTYYTGAKSSGELYSLDYNVDIRAISKELNNLLGTVD